MKLLSCLLLISMLLAAGCAPPPELPSLTVSAAANIQPALEEIAAAYEKETGVEIALNFGATTALAQQISAGAPVDLFFAANTTDVTALAEQDLLLSDTVRPYAVGQLVIYCGPRGNDSVARLEDLAKAAVGRVAIANPERAPYGAAAREALQALGLWDVLRDKLVIGENVAQAFQYAETGNVACALVPKSLTVGKSGPAIPVPETLHRPIIQALGVVAASVHQQEARAFVDFVTGPSAAPVFEKFGYTLP